MLLRVSWQIRIPLLLSVVVGVVGLSLVKHLSVILEFRIEPIIVAWSASALGSRLAASWLSVVGREVLRSVGLEWFWSVYGKVLIFRH